MIREDVRDTPISYFNLTDGQITEDEFIDVLLGTRKYIPALTAINKIDGVSMETLDALAREGDGRTVMLSCELDLGIDWLLESIWRVSFFIRQ